MTFDELHVRATANAGPQSMESMHEAMHFDTGLQLGGVLQETVAQAVAKHLGVASATLLDLLTVTGADRLPLYDTSGHRLKPSA